MLIKQMSVFVENTTGRLAELTRILAEHGIDIKASTIAARVEFGIIRCIVPTPEEATRILTEAGFTASITEVIAVSIEDKPGGFHKVLQILADNDIAVDYIYSAIQAKDDKAIIMIRVEEQEKAIRVLTSNGIKLFSMSELGA